MNNKTLEFHLLYPFAKKYIVPPIPATKTVPSWFKQLPASIDETKTVKKCIPFLDAITAGYVILTHIDIIVRQHSDGSLKVNFINDEHEYYTRMLPPIETHSTKQIEGSPLSSFTILKYMSPWRIKTPKNYSLLFSPLINRPESPIIPLAGLVDTDEFKNVVNIPFIHTNLVKGGSDVIIPAGTPICQIIPIKRDKWSSSVKYDKVDEAINYRKLMDADRDDWYRRHAHIKKIYT